MIADVAFDAPLAHPFGYRVPPDHPVRPGQRVRAPLAGAARIGLVLATREGEGDGLKPLVDVIDPAPVVTEAGLDLLRWIASESLSSLGSTAAALLPPPLPRTAAAADDSPPLASPRPNAAGTPRPEVFIGSGRERSVIERIAGAAGPVLVLTADVEAAARWAQRLAKIDQVVRLDSDAADADRARAWRALATARARLAVGTRSALLAPLGAGAMLVLVDEHDDAHRPPGHPRIHARDVVNERAPREGARLLLTSATPSVETWWRTTNRLVTLVPGGRGAWPSVVIADTRGILRREPLTPELARAVRETLGAGRRAFIGVSRLASALACDECGLILRCAECGVALSYSRTAASLACRLCGRQVALMDRCPGCAGRRLSPFGWGIERVEHAVRRRFPHARVVRYDPEGRGSRRSESRAAAAEADVVIGTRGALRLFGPASLGVVGFVSPDHLLRLPDFGAGERLLRVLWAAAERIQPGGTLVVQSQHPEHHAFVAVAAHDLARFYDPELSFRAELGYPPFRRLAVVTFRKARATPAGLVDDVAAALRQAPGVVVYPPSVGRRDQRHRIVVKGDRDLPATLREALAGFAEARWMSRGIIDAEVDPVEWQS